MSDLPEDAHIDGPDGAIEPPEFKPIEPKEADALPARVAPVPEGPAKHPAAMLEAPRALFAWLGKRLFDHVELAPEMAQRLGALPDKGQVVYVMRTRSLLDYLFFNHLFLKQGLPLARYANGVDLTFFRGVRTWIKARWRAIWGKRALPPPEDQLETAVRGGGASLLFLKRRSLTAELQVQPGYVERLIALQRQLDHPLLLVPQLILWPRKPPSRRRTWFDIAFGDQEASGRFRKLGHFVLNRRMASVRVGAPIDLQQAIADHSGWSDERLARKVRRVLFIHLGREAMAIRGPGVKTPALIRKEIVENKRFRRTLRAVADEHRIAPSDALDRTRKYLKEIGAKTNFNALLITGKIMDFVFSRVFQGVEVDEEGMRRVRDAAKLSRSAPVVLVPSHKSHADYLVISWVFLRNEFIPPHVAAGANLGFFPVGPWLRRCGAFFLRRSFDGQPVYKAVFRQYLWKLVREGYPIEFYPEGGRSRTGKLLPPKLGMMGMLLEGVRRGEYKDLQFIPINLSYEQVVETASYRRELTGGTKRKESAGELVKVGKVLRYRYGRIYISFEKPVRLSEYLEKIDRQDLPEQEETTFRDTTRRLSYHLMRRIQEATVVSPSALIGGVLLSHDRRGLSGARLRELVGFLVDMLHRRGARFSRSVDHLLRQHTDYIEKAVEQGPREGFQARGEALRPLLDEALAQLKKLITQDERGGETIYQVPERARIELDYYRNSILGILAPDAIVATVLRASGRSLPYTLLAKQVRALSYWFRREFIYQTETTFDENLAETLDRMGEEGLIRIEDDKVHAHAPKTLDFLRGALLHLIEGYWVAADSLRGLDHGAVDAKEWLDQTREHAEREFLQGELSRAESASTAILQNAIQLFIQEGLVVEHRSGSGRRRTKTYELAPNTPLEDVAFRRDDLGVYLVKL